MRPEKQQVEGCAAGWMNKKAPQLFPLGPEMEMIPLSFFGYCGGSCESCCLELLISIVEKK